MNEQTVDSRVLIAEGDPELRRTLFRALLERDVFSDTAADGVQVLECLATRTYSVLLLDLTLPKIDTLKLIQHVGSIPSETRPMIMAMAGREISIQLDVELVQVILRRPLRPAEVAELIQNCIRVTERAGRTGKKNASPRQQPVESKDDDDHPVC
jgi:DNA-binding response OmpR family regulator